MFGCCCNQGPPRPEAPERRVLRGIMPWNPKGPGPTADNIDDLEVYTVRPFRSLALTGTAATAAIQSADLVTYLGSYYTMQSLVATGLADYSRELLREYDDCSDPSCAGYPDCNAKRYFSALIESSWQNIADGAAVTYSDRVEILMDYRDGLVSLYQWDISTFSPSPWFKFERDDEGAETTTDNRGGHPYDLGAPYHTNLSSLGGDSTLVAASLTANGDDEAEWEVVVDVDTGGGTVRLTYFGSIVLTEVKGAADVMAYAKALADLQFFTDIDHGVCADVRWKRAGGGWTYDVTETEYGWMEPGGTGFRRVLDFPNSSGAYCISSSAGYPMLGVAAEMLWAKEEWLLPLTWGSGMVEPLPLYTFDFEFDTTDVYFRASTTNVSCEDAQINHATILEPSANVYGGIWASQDIQSCTP